MRRAESADGDWLCVIMRGVPGCGKSSIAREMADAWRVTHQASQRSTTTPRFAPPLLFRGRGGSLPPQARGSPPSPGRPATYRLVFSVERLGRPSALPPAVCRCDQLRVRARRSRQHEHDARRMPHYQRTALHWGYEVLVVEVRSDQNDLGAVEAMRARCTHGVPMPTMLRLNERFEPDDRSNAVARVRPLGLACSNTTPPAPQPSAETSAGAQGPACI